MKYVSVGDNEWGVGEHVAFKKALKRLFPWRSLEESSLRPHSLNLPDAGSRLKKKKNPQKKKPEMESIYK